MFQSTIFFQRKTSTRKLFLKFLDAHFPRAYKFYKIFNHNTAKISYRCMKNMGSVISSHYKHVLQPHNENYGCNFRKKENCLLENKCLTPKSFTKLKFLKTLMMAIKSIQVNLKLRFRKEIATTRKIFNIESI